MESKETLADVAKSSPKTRAIQHKGAVRSMLAVIEALELTSEQAESVLSEVAEKHGLSVSKSI